MVNPRREFKEKNTAEIETPRRRGGQSQEEILVLMAREGKISPHDAYVKLKIGSRPLATKLFSKLVKNQMIGSISEEKVSGGKRIWYGLTDKSIEWLISRNKLTQKDFWIMVFNLFDKQYKGDLSITIDEVFRSYETHSLQIHLEYYNWFVTTRILNLIESIKKKHADLIKESIQALVILSQNNKIDDEVLFHKLKLNNHQREHYINLIIPKLKNHGLIYWWRVKKRNSKQFKLKYGISHFGLLLVFDYLSSNAIDGNNGVIRNEELRQSGNGYLKDDLIKLISQIILVQSKLLPLVFGKWTRLKKIVPNADYDLMTCLIIPYVVRRHEFFDKKSREAFLFTLQSNMEESYRQKLSQFYSVGLEHVYNTALKHECVKYFFSYYDDSRLTSAITLLDYANKIGANIDQVIIAELDDIDLSDSIISKNAQNDDSLEDLTQRTNPKLFKHHEKYLGSKLSHDDVLKIVKRYEQPLRKIAQLYKMTDLSSDDFFLDPSHASPDEDELKALANILSFHFYALLRTVTNENDWKDFFSKIENKGLAYWYNEWIDALVRFEQININVLEKEKVKI